MDPITLKNFKVIYKNNVYRCISIRPDFGAIQTEETKSGLHVPKNSINKAKWIDCIVFDIDGNILLLSDESHMFDFIKDKEVKDDGN